MNVKEVLFSSEAREKMLRGVDILANAVKETLGPKGRNAVIDQPFGSPRITKDGVSVAREIKLKDKFENMGAQMLREVATKTAHLAGDGTTTATVLAQAIVREGAKLVAAGMNPMDLKRGIDMAVEAVVEDIKTLSKPVSTSEEIAQVGTISANGEREIGRILADAVEKIGKDGVITIEDSKSFNTELDIVEGLQFDRGYISPYFVTNSNKMVCELDKPYVLAYEGKISNLQPIISILEAVIQSGRSILIIAEDVDGEALASLVLNKVRAGLKVVAVKSPGFGDRRNAILEDIAILTGGHVISEDTGGKLDALTLNMLGSARKITVSKDDTIIVGGSGSQESVNERCEQIADLIESASSEYEKDKLKERLAKIKGGVAVIRVGGATEIEVKERKDRVEDAMYATRAAIAEGIVPGGGVALVRSREAVKMLEPQNSDQEAGIKIIYTALAAPCRQIAENAGSDGSVILGKIVENSDENYGYDAQSNVFCDMFEAGIIDPTKVVRTALQDAASVASLIITTSVAIADAEDEKKAHSAIDNTNMKF